MFAEPVLGEAKGSRPVTRYARDRIFPVVVIDHCGRARSAYAVGSEAAKRSAQGVISRCNRGAISVEKMEFIDLMDVPELTPSREKTENTPINLVYKHLIGFEVRRSIH